MHALTKQLSQRLLFFVMVFAGTSLVCSAKDKTKTVYPVAVFAFDERGTDVKDYGAKVSELLVVQLAANPRMYLVDRADLQKTLAEQALNISGAVDAAHAVQVGQLTGAQLLVTGSVVQIDKKLILIAKIIGAQSSRVLGTTAEGKISDDLTPLVVRLSENIIKVVAEQADELVPNPRLQEDRLALLKKSISDGEKKQLPSLAIRVSERHVGRPSTDPAVEIELSRYARGLGFTLLDSQAGSRAPADVMITGEGFSELAGRVHDLVAVKARVELKVTERATGKVLLVDRQTTVHVDLAEQIAGKSALQEAGAVLAERVLPKLVKSAKPVKENKKKGN